MRFPTKKEVGRFLTEAIVGAATWTIALTPYMIGIVQVNLDQYLDWLVMEFVLVPPIAPVVFRVTRRVLGKLCL